MRAVRTLAALMTAAGFAVVAGQTMIPSQAEASQRSSSLAASMYCEFGHCEATASGGSGDYTWSWTNANPSNTTGTISSATPCWTYDGQTVTVTATVSDGSSTASASRRYRCSY